ncbi:MaoC family dehydratase [Rhodococcus koreensis]|uniref:MaoC family dehydratase n=1 Tax=Rhodococcus koreensis TaxID=99653 RepID=UPI00366AF21E
MNTSTSAAGATTHTPARSVTMAELPALVGTRLGSSGTMVVTQDRIDTFAEATDDRQWIHVDHDRARTGPFGTTIAHGYLTLSLAVPLLWEIFEVSDCDQVVNYGLNKVRFPAPVPVDSMLSAVADLVAVEPCTGGYQATIALTFDVEGGSRPVCIVEMLLRFLAG